MYLGGGIYIPQQYLSYMKPILKYPVILVHGIAAKDNNLFWGRIPATLKQHSIPVFWGNMDSWGSIINNANALRKTVDSVLQLSQQPKVNIIAHSKGGIDARFLISTLGYADKVASLTTISTPHHGTEIVDYILSFKQLHTPLTKKISFFLARLYGDKEPDPYKAAVELSTQSMEEFNRNNPNQEGVYYSSCCSILRNCYDDLSYLLTYRYIKGVSGDNDGIVSAQSAKWGDNFCIIKGASHAEITDMKRKNISGLNIPGEYLKIIDHLASKGF